MHKRLAYWLVLSLSLGVWSMPLSAQPGPAQSGLDYPHPRKDQQKDSYHGTVVEDPYRWLEDDRSHETAKWVEAENKVTFGYLDKIPYRAQLKEKLLQLNNFPRYGQPFHRGETYFFSKNDGLQKQSVYYVQKGLEGTPEVFLDPNKLSEDGTTSLSFLALDKTGKYAAYGTSKGGSDWRDIYVLDVASRKTLSDHLQWAKVTGASWAGDGFFYSRYDAPADGHTLSSKNENHKVFFHRVGQAQSEDQLIYEDPLNSQRFHVASTDEDQRFLFIDISDRGKGKKGNAIYFRDLRDKNAKLRPLIAEVGDDTYHLIDSDGDSFLVETDHGAPKGRVVRIDPDHPEESNWKVIIPEGPDTLAGVSTGGEFLFAHYLKDATTRIRVYTRKGRWENEIKLPGLGSAGGFGSLKEDNFVFYTYTSYNAPTTIYRYDFKTKKSKLFRKPELAFEPDNYVIDQVLYRSKDGTRVPMFIVFRKGLQRNGNNPTLLYGYGGFNISLTPSFSPSLIALLDQGVVYCVANLRGGGEYGEDWHRAGMLSSKQNVYDDFIAAAEFLISEKYTNPDKLAIQGGSNGGLLVAVVMNQRPELFKVGLAAVGVMDMLRFHKFTIGWNWSPEYGSSDNPEQFKTLIQYSPLHNIKVGARYPAILITTADHDDRVVPAHSFKYAAAMQEKAGHDNPVLIRIDTKSGHGSSNLIKGIELTADVYAFLLFNLGVTPKL